MSCRNNKLLYAQHFPFLWVVFLLLCLPILSASQSQSTRTDSIDIYDVELYSQKTETTASDTLIVKFNLYKQGGTDDEDRLLVLSPTDSLIFDIKELYRGREQASPEYLQGSLEKRRTAGFRTEIPEDFYISILVDRGSYDEEEMDNIKLAIAEFAHTVKEGHLFYSWFDSDISESRMVTVNTIDSLDFSVSDKPAALNNALYTKLLEFDTIKLIDIGDYENYYKRNKKLQEAKDGEKYLIVLTNRRDQLVEIDKYLNIDDVVPIYEPTLINEIEKYKKKVYIYSLNIGNEEVDPEFLNMICRASGNEMGFYSVQSDSILKGFFSLGEQIAKEDYDYEMLLKYGRVKRFQAENRILKISLVPNEKQPIAARGRGGFGSNFGSQGNPLTAGDDPETTISKLLYGLLTGFIVFLIVLFTVQLIIPLIRNKIFVLKYVRKYKPKRNEIYKECQYCGDPINKGEKVVVKCQHLVHHLCWKDYDHMCPEYGQNCNEGKEDFFDISDPFSRKNKIYYAGWVINGMFGGFLAWVLYFLVMEFDPRFVFDFSDWVIRLIRPGDESTFQLRLKIASFLVEGVLLGFFLTLFFSFIEEYRNKSFYIYLRIILRGVLGGLTGFFASAAGCIIVLLIPIFPEKGWYFDLIPWLFFGVSIGVVMSIKTTISWKHGVLGGLISIIFCFILIYGFATDLEKYAVIIGFMIYGAGLGGSIATIRSRSEQFFLKIEEGKKNLDVIPVHKWMSSSGGHNEVYIGRSFACEIQMNWEKNNEEIAEKHAKLYINTRGAPVIISLDADRPTHFNDRFDMNPGKEYELYNGVRFKIGNTVYKYVETD